MAPVDIGPCKAAVVRWYYDPEDRSCKDFVFGGCDGNTNNFATKEKCERTCTKFVAEGDSGNCFFASDTVGAVLNNFMQTPALMASFLASVCVTKPSFGVIMTQLHLYGYLLIHSLLTHQLSCYNFLLLRNKSRWHNFV